MYIYCNADTKKIDVVRYTALPPNQKNDRIEIIIDDTHPAYSDCNRKIHYQLNENNNGIEESGIKTSQEKIELYILEYQNNLIAMGYSGDSWEFPDILAFIDNLMQNAADNTERIAILYGACKSMAYFTGAIANGYSTKGE
jgi:hypothetical protein